MLSIIAALTKDKVIGKDNSLIWNLPEDLQNFKKITSGHPVIMGRKTWESIPEKFRPLPGRRNIVISSSVKKLDGADVFDDVYKAIEDAQKSDDEVFVIGGSTVYRQTVPLADRLYLSWVKRYYEGDAYFPDFDENEWAVIEKKEFDGFDFMVYEKKK